jgi:O-antigen/teichoic acid export membrane protein
VWLFNFVSGITLLLSGFIILIKNGVDFSDVVPGIKRGANLFLTNTAINIYTNSSLLWVGLLSGQSDVTRFAVFERMTYMSRGGLVLYAQIILPKVSKWKSGKRLYEIEKINFYFMVILLLVGAFVFFFSDLICLFFLKKNDVEVIKMLKIFSLMPIIIGASVLPNQWLVAHAMHRDVRNIFFTGAISALFFIPIGYWLGKLTGVCLGLLCVELLITILLLIHFDKKKKHIL